MMKALRLLIPENLKIGLRKWLHAKQRKFKTPKMLWGHLNSSGNWQPKTRISDTVSFYHPENINIADNVFIGHYAMLDGTGTLEIEEGVQISAMGYLLTHSSHIAVRLYGSHYSEVPEYNKKGYLIDNVKVGRYAFIGAGAKILPGVSIGRGALIAAGAVVNKNVEDFHIVAGIPAVVVGDTRTLDAGYLDDPQLKEWYEEWQRTEIPS